MTISKITYASLFLAALSVPSATAFAQESNLQDARENSAADEIIVTARRRAEAMSTVPASISNFSTDDIASAGITSLRDIADLSPNFSLTDNYRPGLERFQTRGLITPQVGDAPLVFVIDGVTASAPSFANLELFDVENVQVLRGANGALYGRGAVGGAVIVTSAAPTNDPKFGVKASYGNENTIAVSGFASGPVVEDKVFIRLGAYNHESGGFVENTFLNEGSDYYSRRGLKGQLEFNISPDTHLKLLAYIGESEDGIGYYDPVAPSQSSLEDFSILTAQNVLGKNDRTFEQVSLRLNQAFSFGDLELAGSIANTHDDGIADGDLVALQTDGVNFFPSWQRAQEDIDSVTLEGRLTSKADDVFNWSFGAYYQDRNRDTTFSVFDDPSGLSRLTQADLGGAFLLFAIQDESTSEAAALSAQASYKITPQIEVALAGRYDRDERSSVDPRDVTTTNARLTFDAFQPKASVSYQARENVFLYAGYSQGFRSGGFNEFSPLVRRSYDSEETDSYELGAKMDFFDKRLTVNGALFRNDQTDAQITRFNPNSFTLENLGIDSVQSQGAEIEMLARITPSFTLRFNAGLTNSEIKAFAENPAVIGAAMPYVPEYDMALSADYTHPLSDDLSLEGFASYRRVGPRSFTLDFADLSSDAHDFVDLRLGLNKGEWNLTAFVENAFDERQPEDLFAVFNGAVELARQPNRPRYFGVEIGYGF